VYDRQINDQTLTFGVSGMLYQNGLIMYDHQTQSLWSHILGQSISGDYQGTRLEFMPALQTDWQSWVELHPETRVVSPEFYGADVYDGYYLSQQEGVLGRQRQADELDPKEYVIGVRLAGESRAYPFSILNAEPVVNDQVGEIPIVVLFDETTASGTAFDRAFADGTELTFQPGPNPRTAIDTQTQTEWNILTGTAMKGSLVGDQLSQVPITYAFWFGWADYHVNGSVYQGPGGLEQPTN
jgi:hypothetical protein